MKAALDTNILAYAEGLNDGPKKQQAWRLVEKLPEDTVIPVQALGELFTVLVRRAERAPEDARTAVLRWEYAFRLADTSGSVFLGALELVSRQFSLWDAVMLSAAAEAGCSVLLSEDRHPGFTWNGVTIVDPFAQPEHPLLEQLLKSRPS
ncbi:MAG: PIN domain-containing protein [Acidobacteriaceae bacterium]